MVDKMGIIDDVKQRTDIVEVISQYLPLTKAGRTFRGLCPFHPEKNPSFYVYPEQQSWHCFGCNSGGDVFSFVMKKENSDFGETLRLLAERAGVTISPRFEPEAQGKEKERLYQINETAAQYFHNLLLNSPAADKARNYVSGRGLSSKTVTDFQLGFSLNSWDALKQYMAERGYSEDELLSTGLVIQEESGKTHDRFRNRLMFPIHDIKRRIIGFGARALDDSLPKYLNSPQTLIFDKSGNLYGINQATAAIRQQDMAVLVEGYMDTITAHQNGANNVVASMGTSVTEKQISALKKLTKNITFALDADAAGQEAMLRGVGYENTLGAEIKIIVLPEGKDPDDVIREDAGTWQQLVDAALPIVDYTFNMTTSRLNLSTSRGQSLAVEGLIPIIDEIKDDIRLDHYLTELSKKTGITYSILEATLAKYRAGKKAKAPKPQAVARVLKSLLSSPTEEYCLTLLLQYPELKNRGQELLPEHFENSENREIFVAWQQATDPSSLRETLDPAIREHLDAIIEKYKNLPANQLERKIADCILRLQDKFYRNLEAKRAVILASEAERGGTAAELAMLEEQGTEVSVKLGKVHTQKNQRR